MRRPVPEDWASELKETEIDSYPLVADSSGHPAGWTSYTTSILESPECEIICGGVNTKTAAAAAVWRQGNLLHFGFQCAPSEMNEFGRGLLVNSMAYIARFRQDRPIAMTESVFVKERVAPPSARLLSRGVPSELQLEVWFDNSFSAPRKAAAGGLDAWRAWVEAEVPFLSPNAEGYLVHDPDLSALGVPLRDPRLFDALIEGLTSGGEPAQRAFRILHRYFTTGPLVSHFAHALAAWKAWLVRNRLFLFFSESGGYRWYVDHLAQSRGTASAHLRGPARADR